MISPELMNQYAELLIVRGVHVQKGQTLLINASIHAREMTLACVKAAYAHGAAQVLVFYQDEELQRLDYLYQETSKLIDVHPWQIDCKLDYLKEGACILHITSEIPGSMKGLDAAKINSRNIAFAKANRPAQRYTMENKTQWCVAAVPNQAWAEKVFPEFTGEAAMEALWRAILKAVHVDAEHDSIMEWKQRNLQFQARVKQLNQYRFDALHFQNMLGTDLMVQLPKGHVWAGGSDVTTTTNVEFDANIPTEEVFTMPHLAKVDGIVYASKPLSYQGTLIDDFWLSFQAGKVVDYDAGVGKEALTSLLQFDEGSCRLGEVALVSYDTIISKSGILYYNTLFDENASCHLALGDSYISNLQGGEQMDAAQRKAAGANTSLLHVDFMFGTKDMQIDGITSKQEEIPVFREGNFVF